MHKCLVYNKFIIFLYMFRALLCSKHVEDYNKFIVYYIPLHVSSTIVLETCRGL